MGGKVHIDILHLCVDEKTCSHLDIFYEQKMRRSWRELLNMKLSTITASEVSHCSLILFIGNNRSVQMPLEIL